ncbi:MAG TPA: gamma-glutamylcyclotransferase family protein [Gammaproteobacteria bacterium]|nr:gamma-glutamylcyclotransferase family protein [Gammaproteobacteria bacterium]
MNSHQVDVFFYGSYINFAVLAEAEIDERPYRIARLPGYRLTISPLANLVRDESSEAYGILTRLTHRELDGLYVGHAQEKLGGTYLPEAVVVTTAENISLPALCYLSHDMRPSKPDSAYVDRILNPARRYGFPAEYLRHIASFSGN